MQKNFYLHSNTISAADKGCEAKEQLFSDEQKLRKARARRLILETNRRRRALEDKQKQRDVREQQLREKVLQLRRQRIQEATERFQKAHLQPSQRQLFGRNIPTIEEALDEIKSNLNGHRSGYSPSKTTLVIDSSPRPRSPGIEHQGLNTDVNKHKDVTNNNRPANRKNSESLVLKDSLESPSSFFLFDADRPRLHRDRVNFTSPSSGLTPFFVRKLEESEELHNKNWKSDTQPYLDKQQLFTLVGADAGHSDAVVRSIKAACGNGEFCGSLHERILDLKQQMLGNDAPLKLPSAPILPSPGKDAILVHHPNILSSHSSSDNTSGQETKQEHPKNDLNRLSSAKNEKPVHKTLLHQTRATEAVRCVEDEGKYSVAMATCDPTDRDQFMKGILRNQLQKDAVHFRDDVVFAQQVALAIRDSVELTRARAKEKDGVRAVKKKLRWFDGGQEDEQTTGKLCHSSQSQDHRAGTVPGGSKHGRGITTGYHFTKQAWADAGVQVNLPPEPTGEVKVQPCVARADGPSVPWRERCERAREGSVTLRTRKGIAVRPQSATEVSRIAKTQGKMIAPRPPPPRTRHAPPYGTTSAAADRQQDDSLRPPHVTGIDSNTLTPSGPSESTPKVRPRSFPADRAEQASAGRSICLECTPTEEQISELWHSVRSALTSQNADGRAVGGEKVRPPSGQISNRPPSWSQQRKEAADSSRPETHTRQTTTEEAAVPRRESATILQHRQTEHLTLSLEERKILLSLDRLDQQLHRVCEQAGLEARVADKYNRNK